MALKYLSIAIGLLNVAVGLPAPLQDMLMVDDTMSVGSYIRPVRAAAPEDYHKSYEKQGDGEIGYSRKKSGGGKKGYQHFESFHKKAGDNFEFEKQDSFGLDKEEQQGAHSHRHEQREKYQEPEKEAYKYGYEFENEDEGEGRSRHNKKKENLKKRPADAEEIDNKKEEHPDFEDIDHEELRAGANDGNGGIEAYGHNPDDYKLPEKYTYGDAKE